MEKHRAKRSFFGSLLGRGDAKDKGIQKQIERIKEHEWVKIIEGAGK